MTFPASHARLVSFDGSTAAETSVQKPDKYRFFDQAHAGPLIARGAGLSYAAASFGSDATSVDCSAFNRFLSYQEGIFKVEAGTTLGQVYSYLLRYNRYLAVQPGHPNITIGGCVAAEVHGKNQFRDGTFGSQVEGLTLFHPRHGILEVSRNQHPELFDLTSGGYGLTGIILNVSLRTRPIPSPAVEITTIPVPDIEQFEAILTAQAPAYDLIYSWHDFTAGGREFGRGFIIAGKFSAAAASLPAAGPASQKSLSRTLVAERRGNWPISFFSPRRTRWFNRAYYFFTAHQGAPQKIDLYRFLFPVSNKEAYFKLFGKKGFHECQFIIPAGKFSEWVRRVRDCLARSPQPITLASGKLFSGAPRLLRFTGAGVCFALNFPRTERSPAVVEFLHALAIEIGAIPNSIKDSSLTAAVVAATYPEYERFRSALRRFDPDRIFQSELSHRLDL